MKPSPEPPSPKAPAPKTLGLTTVPKKLVAALALALMSAVAFFALRKPFPPDTTPEGAYLRVAQSVIQGRLRDAFPYLETEAQWSCYSIRDDRREAASQIEKFFPEAERVKLASSYAAEAKSADGADILLLMSQRFGFEKRLSKDLSGIVKTEIEGDRATLTTARGTRYSMRRRDNGIWGLTLFTAELMQERARASRDRALVSESAQDYERAKTVRP
jgi:hypothetical protein